MSTIPTASFVNKKSMTHKLKKPKKKKEEVKNLTITRSAKCVVPSGIQYSNTDHFLSVSSEVGVITAKEVEAVVTDLDVFLETKIREYFNTYNEFMKAKGAEGHRVTMKDGVRCPHVSDILSAEFPFFGVANSDEYVRIGNAGDRLWKTFKRENKWVKEDFHDSGLIKTTYEEMFNKSIEWFDKFGKEIVFHEDSLECYNPTFNYVGECDLVGTYEGYKTLFDVKISRDIKGKSLERYLCQLAAYAECLEGIEQVCLISPFCEPIVEGDIKKWVGRFLVIRGKYQERFGI